MRELGGTVELVGESFYEAQIHAQAGTRGLVQCFGCLKFFNRGSHDGSMLTNLQSPEPSALPCTPTP